MKKQAVKPKQGVSKELLALCVGSDLESQRLAKRDSYTCEAVVINDKGNEMEAKEWLKLNKKKLNA